MGDIAQRNPGAADDPVPLRTQSFTQFKGIYTRASRTAIPDDYFYNLENMIPIGAENLHTVPGPSATLIDYTTDTIYWSQGVNLNGTEYLVNFATNGKIFFYNIGAKTSAQVNGGNLFSGAGSQCDQWKNTIILFIDSTGYYSYDGTTFSKITGVGVPAAGNSIAVYSGRVWIVNGRVLTTSALDDYTAAAFAAANGAVTTNLTDPQIRGTVQRLKAQNGYLYLIANTGINAISDVYVPAGASPPAPVFANQNIQAIIGTDQPASTFPYDRLLMFASRYGMHSLFGVTAPKVSGNIDGTWQYLDFSQSISGGQVVVNNILCAAFLLKRLNDPLFGSNTIIALWFQNSDVAPQTGVTETADIWWFGNFGSVTFIVSGIVNNVPALFGFVGNKLIQFFTDTAHLPTATVQTKLWPMEDPLARKEAVVAGVEFYAYTIGTGITLSLDTENNVTPLSFSPNLSMGTWINAALQTGLWYNSALTQGVWSAIGGTLFLVPTDPKGGYGRHLGLTFTSTGYNIEMHMLSIDYKLRDRWL